MFSLKAYIRYIGFFFHHGFHALNEKLWISEPDSSANNTGLVALPDLAHVTPWCPVAWCVSES
jgi:hypothetical protein